MMSVIYNFSVVIFMMYTSSHVWMLSLDILLNIKEYDKCPQPVVCHKNVSVNNNLLNATIWLVSVDEEFPDVKTVRSVHGDVMIMASLSPCQRHFSPSSHDITVCPLVCSTFLSSQSIYIQSVFNVTNTEQTIFNALVSHDSLDDVMTGITSILWHVKWKTVVVITSAYGVFTALSGGRLASIKLLLYMIDDPNNPLESIDLASIYQLLPVKDLNLLVMCPSDCIQKLLNQGRFLESNMSVAKASGGPQWLMVPSTGSVMDLAHSVEPFKTEKLVFLEFMPCSRSYLPLNIDVITQHSTSSERTNMTDQAAEITESLQKSVIDGEYPVQAKLKVLGRGHSGTNVETVGYIGRDDSVQVKHPLYHANYDGFHNRTLIVGTLEWPPFVIRKVENGSVKFDGLCIQLLQELAKQLNFSYTLVEPEDREWSRVLNGSWTGLVKLLTDGEVDLVVAPMSVSHSRAAAIDFTVPFFYAHSALILSKQDPNSNKWLTLLSLFRYEVLICILVSLIFSTVLIFVIEEVTPVRSWTDDRPTDMQTRYGDILWYHFGALMANGGAYLPNTESGRTVLSCWWLFTVIMAATYSGNLIAFLTDGREKPPFSSLAEMAQQDTYSWGFVGGAFLVTLFQESNISAYQIIWHRVEEMTANHPDWLSHDGNEHLRRAAESKYVYIAEGATFEMWDDPRRCHLQAITDNFAFGKYAVGLPKHSIYTQLFSKQILKVYESGLVHMWWNRWKPKHQCMSPSRKSKRIDILALQSAFYIAGIGVAISLMVLVIETIHNRRSKQRLPRQSDSVEEDDEEEEEESVCPDTSSQDLPNTDIVATT
ncbi:glutamate receptor ionotropic, kainate 2-like [Haliotis rubra]|uniref:glutamate receptor ionotropic, kainate 2-like n=1 Tax=Haliotis rubra TaxID=36100 RepID=UPI001EE5CEAF|nr:glutamate receptor ionotropic, kainate 2-like [Haliotis rubra]